MKESQTYRELRPFLARLFAVDRVENAVTPGMADVLLSSGNCTIYIEMKAAIGWRLRGSQCAWATKRIGRGCRDDMFILTRWGDQYVIFWTVDVVNNAGVVSLELEHVIFNEGEQVAKFFHDCIYNEDEAENVTRRRVGKS